METEDFSLFDMTPDLVCLAGKDGYFKKINPAVCHKLQYPEADLMSKPIASFIHPDDKERTAAERLRLLQNQTLLNFQNRYLTSKGEVVWLEWTSVYLADKEIVFAIAKDITFRKLSELEREESLQTFQQLTRHFKARNEKDRESLASELQEDLAQLATALKLRVEWMATKMPRMEPQLNHLLEETLESATLLVNKIRKISCSLSPAHLTLFNLDTALRLVCTEFTVVSGIPCAYKSRFAEEGITAEVKLDIYRICQEALQNIWQHAGATTAGITLVQTGDTLELAITDNGRGFDTRATQQFGLATVQGRSLSINGRLSIESNTVGTIIRLNLTAYNCAIKKHPEDVAHVQP
jgi:PAS domain S-box-containing protein